MNNYITGRVSFLTLETFDETNIVLILTTIKKTGVYYLLFFIKS